MGESPREVGIVTRQLLRLQVMSKALLELELIRPGTPHVGRDSEALEKEIPDPTRGWSKRPFELNHQDDPVLVCLVPDFVPVRVVENSELSELPTEFLGAYMDPALTSLVRDDETQVAVDHPLGDAAVLANEAMG